VFEVAAIPELSSAVASGAQTRLVSFPSLDVHHFIALQGELQPSRHSFIEGVPPSPENKWRRSAIATLNGLERIVGAERVLTSTLDYGETLDCLLRLYARHAYRDRILIAPTGSKMQTVAVGLFRAFITDVQIVYPTPAGFPRPSRYTLGVGAIHMLSLAPFASADSSLLAAG
jgi:hypothetical protein